MKIILLQDSSLAVEAKPPARKTTPEANASLLSQLFMLWTMPLLSLSKRKRKEGAEIEEVDLWGLCVDDQTSTLSTKFERAWQHGIAEKKYDGQSTEHQARRTLLKALWAVGGRHVLLSGFANFFAACMAFTFPLIMLQILQFIEELDTREAEEGFMYAGLLGLFMIGETLCISRVLHFSTRANWHLRSAITTAVYRKSLHLTSSSRLGKTSGEIVNYMQLDAERVAGFAYAIHSTWKAPLQIVIYVVMVYQYIGWSAFVGFGTILAFLPINTALMSVVYDVMDGMVDTTDERVNATNETLQGMLGVKMAAWEENVSKLIKSIRAVELKHLRKYMFVNAASLAIMSSVPSFTTTSAIAVYIIYGNGSVSASILFTAIAIFERLRYPLEALPECYAQYIQASIGVNRLAAFLALDEIAQVNDVDIGNNGDPSSPTAIEIVDGEFFWVAPGTRANTEVEDNSAEIAIAKTTDPKQKYESIVQSESSMGSTANPTFKNSGLPTLQDINLKVARGKLVAIVGPVGCGKSSFCNAMLGEMYTGTGTVTLSGSVAYAAQSSWILNATVRDNILFSEPYDEVRYKRVLETCQLAHDLKTLSAGDMTMIGERGINLSGGQKQRISVARTAYSSKDIVILDDPLSALDPAVAGNLFKECIAKFMKDRTRVLVTNQLNVLKDCDWIVVLSATTQDNDDHDSEAIVTSPGRVVEQGTFAQLNVQGTDFASLVKRFNKGKSEPGMSDSTGKVEATPSTDDDSDGGESQVEQQGDNLMTKEERSSGAVTWAVYRAYFRTGGGAVASALVLMFYALTQVVIVLSPQWVAFWSESAELNYTNIDFIPGWDGGIVFENGTFMPDVENDSVRVPLLFFVSVYAGIACFLPVIACFRSISIALFSLRASVKIHADLLDSILHAPMSFFDQVSE
jgi:ATP-binding cassette subfamily C (CFTR/MRP) protein 1